jgi:Protein of unknown function (DUF2778)
VVLRRVWFGFGGRFAGAIGEEMHRGTLNAGARRGTRRWVGAAYAVVAAFTVASVAATLVDGRTSPAPQPTSEPSATADTPAARIRDSFSELRFSALKMEAALSNSETKLAKIVFAKLPTNDGGARAARAELVQPEAVQSEPAQTEPVQTVASAVPLPRPRPTEANTLAREIDGDRPEDPTLLDKVSGMFKYRLTLASLAPTEGIFAPKLDLAALGYDGETAVYDISAHVVYLPNGRKFEAHSGLGDARDDLSHVSERKVGPTPPAVYDLKPREALFHGVQALRMNPVEGNALGRTGLLVHPYMLGPNGDSNGCVSVRDYDSFLAAYQKGDFKRLAVVPNLGALTRQSSL